jgi:hypothetical protein
MNMKQKSVSFISISLLLLFLASIGSCRKDGDTEAPLIEVTSPSENQEFNVSQEIPVIGSVYDNQRLQFVRIVLLNENMVPVLSPLQMEPDGNSMSLNHSYPIDDKLMETGFYYLQIQAGDGEQVTNKYIRLKIHASPKTMSYVVAVTRNGNNLNIVKIDSSWNISTLATLNSDFLGAGVCNDYGLFYVGGRSRGNITVFDITDWQTAWEIPVTIDPPFEWFTGMQVEGSTLRVGYRNGKYERYNRNGDITTLITTGADWSVRNFCTLGPMMITEERSQTGLGNLLMVRYEFSGAIDGSQYIPDPALGIIAADQTNAILVCNDSDDQAYLQWYNINYHNFSMRENIGSGKANAVFPYRDGLMITHEQGVYFYDPAHTTFSIPLDLPGAGAAFYDQVNQLLYCGQNTTLKVYYDVGVVPVFYKSVDLGDSILAVYTIYNKD